MTRINGWASLCLVALRLAIGWHFFIEGLHKIHSHQVGKTSTNTPWSSEGFFREGYGPAADAARAMLGLKDDQLIERCSDETVRDDLFAFKEQVERHFHLTPNQSLQTRKVLMMQLASLTDDIRSSNDAGAIGNLLAKLSDKQKMVDEYEHGKMPAFNSQLDKAQLRNLKNEHRSAQTQLAKMFDQRVKSAKSKYLDAVQSSLTDEQKKDWPMPEIAHHSKIEIVDETTMWSHLILGGLLLAGLLTRSSAMLLGLFLASVLLIAPPVPWAPTPPGSVGHYMFVNLYTIEMIAVFALAFLPTGQWFGVDALFARRFRRIQEPTHGAGLDS